jgi:hypothetical protein
MTRIRLIALVAATVAALRFSLALRISFTAGPLSGSVSLQNVPWMLVATHAAGWLVNFLLFVVLPGSGRLA